jgi:hypothetical protein
MNGWINFFLARRFSPNIVCVHMMRESVLLNKPVAIGQAVLDISKLEMYQLRYDHLKKIFQSIQRINTSG